MKPNIVKVREQWHCGVGMRRVEFIDNYPLARCDHAWARAWDGPDEALRKWLRMTNPQSRDRRYASDRMKGYR